ncbi:MAG: replication initiation protein, partial [Sarcina sp.]
MRLNIEKNLIVKANSLIESKYALPPNCQVVLGYIISLVNPLEDKRFKQVNLNIHEISELLGVPIKNTYKEVSNLVGKLMSATVGIYSEEEEKYIFYNWFHVCKYDDKNAKVEFLLHEELNPYLLDLKKHYTKYHYSNVIDFKHKYSTRIYEFMKRYQFKGNFELRLDDFKALFLCDGYSVWKDLRKRVIETAIGEINEKSDIKVEYDLLKTKRAVTGLKFTIKSKPRILDSDCNNVLEGQVSVDECINEEVIVAPTPVIDVAYTASTVILKSIELLAQYKIKISSKTLERNLNTYGEDVFNRAINILVTKKESGEKITAPVKYLTGILENLKANSEVAATKVVSVKKLEFSNYSQRDIATIEQQAKEIIDAN